MQDDTQKNTQGHIPYKKTDGNRHLALNAFPLFRNQSYQDE